jgi:hypothetical protein
VSDLPGSRQPSSAFELEPLLGGLCQQFGTAAEDARHHQVAVPEIPQLEADILNLMDNGLGGLPEPMDVGGSTALVWTVSAMNSSSRVHQSAMPTVRNQQVVGSSPTAGSRFQKARVRTTQVILTTSRPPFEQNRPDTQRRLSEFAKLTANMRALGSTP